MKKKINIIPGVNQYLRLKIRCLFDAPSYFFQQVDEETALKEIQETRYQPPLFHPADLPTEEVPSDEAPPSDQVMPTGNPQN